MGMTPKREAFARAVASGKSQAEAYRATFNAKNMKPETVMKRASELALGGDVQGRIKELQAQAAEIAVLDKVKILREVDRLAMSDLRGVYDAEEKRIKLPHELDDATAAAVKSFKVDEFGRIEYVFHDKRGSLDMAMKHLGLYEKDNAQKPAEIREIRLVALKPDSSVDAQSG